MQPLLNQQHLKNLVNIEIINNEEKLVAIKRDEYRDGNIYSNGERRSYAWQEYEDEKKLLNPRAGGDVDLIYTGSFISAFEITEKGEGYIFKSNDAKSDLLSEKYNNSKSNIFNLSQKAFNDFLIKYVKDDFIKVLKKQLGQ